MSYSLSRRSRTAMAGVDGRLRQIVELAIKLTSVDFGVSEGLRTLERQEYLVATGKSRTLKSRHLIGGAVDVFAWVDSGVSWDMEYYERIALAFYIAADRLNYRITWGGSWSGFLDGPHFQIEN